MRADPDPGGGRDPKNQTHWRAAPPKQAPPEPRAPQNLQPDPDPEQQLPFGSTPAAAAWAQRAVVELAMQTIADKLKKGPVFIEQQSEVQHALEVLAENGTLNSATIAAIQIRYPSGSERDGSAAKMRTSIAAALEARLRADMRQQDEEYAAAEAVDRERNERQARERAAASSPPPEEELHLDAVRRARIARFHHDAGVG